MMSEQKWITQSVADCLDKVTAPTCKLQTKDYKQSGQFPIVDQGQELIAGWTDNADGIVQSPLPLVVFGDHTRALKYIDFPFVRGADGTQLLKPKNNIVPLFFYYACKAIDIPARGYNRHFTILKEKDVSFPKSEEEQTQIASALRKIELSVSLQEGELSVAQELKRATMRELFTRGLRGERQKETEIGLVPESWDVEQIRRHYDVASGGTPSRTVPAYWVGGTIPWVKTTEVGYCTILDTEEKITPEGLKNSAAKMFPAGTLLMAMYGQGVTRGKVAILGIEAACNQACAAMNPRVNDINPKYLFHFLTYRYEDIRQLAHGGQQQNLNLDIVRDLLISFPTNNKEQREIVEILDAIDQKIDLHKRKKAVLEELFKSLLHKLMTGEIRVTDLDLSALDIQEKERAMA